MYPIFIGVSWYIAETILKLPLPLANPERLLLSYTGGIWPHSRKRQPDNRTQVRFHRVFEDGIARVKLEDQECQRSKILHRILLRFYCYKFSECWIGTFYCMDFNQEVNSRIISS